MKSQLKPGLHIAIVTNPRPGSGGSLLAWESYQACQHFGPAILATFDTNRHYPLPCPDLRRLPLTDAGRYSLLPIVEEARKWNKMLIIDTRPGFTGSDPMFDILSEAALEDAASATALVAVQHGMLGWDEIRQLCRPFSAIGAKFDRGLVRDWGLRRDEAGSIPTADKPSLHRWSPPFLTGPMLEHINADPAASADPCERRLREAIDGLGKMPVLVDEDFKRKMKEYHQSAQEAVWQAVLEPITLPGSLMSDAEDYDRR